ncbi:MAG: hypothetical protein RMM17_07480 [Acidobacteriota bacterium]|nr:hypothetical protein [Blastocatellia bacterium]MDW8412507.1 hypothetical protein [Acidobacteriota bacterium]
MPVEKVSLEVVAARIAQSRNLQPSEATPDTLTQMSRELQQSLAVVSVVVIPPDGGPSAAYLSSIATFSVLSEDELRQLLSQNRPVPIACTFDLLEAKAIEEKLRRDGIEVYVLGDDVLAPQQPPQRVRKLEFERDEIVLFPEVTVEAPKRIKTESIRLIVEGRIVRRQIEAREENKSFARTERELVDVIEFVDQNSLADFYTDSPQSCFRVREESFDYSGLRGRMQLTAAANFRLLIDMLCEMARPVYDNTYRKASKLLDPLWPSTKRTESLGVKRTSLSPGKVPTASRQVIDNELQFNRYSRLGYKLLKMSL